MGRIFISYRREDSEADANALYQSLCADFGAETVFKDVHDVDLGVNWRNAVLQAIEQADVVLCLMGPDWQLGSAIALELETALEQEIPIIPLLVRGARIEDVTQGVPDEFFALADYNGVDLRHRHWERDLLPVKDAIHRALDAKEATPNSPDATDGVVPERPTLKFKVKSRVNDKRISVKITTKGTDEIHKIRSDMADDFIKVDGAKKKTKNVSGHDGWWAGAWFGWRGEVQLFGEPHTVEFSRKETAGWGVLKGYRLRIDGAVVDKFGDRDVPEF